MKYDTDKEKNDEDNLETEMTQGISGLLKQQGSNDDGLLGSSSSLFFPLTVKPGQLKRPSGFQPELVCLSPWIDSNTPPLKITSLVINSSYSLLAYGNENGLVIIDLIQRCCVLNVGTSELYGKLIFLVLPIYCVNLFYYVYVQETQIRRLI